MNGSTKRSSIKPIKPEEYIPPSNSETNNND